MCVWCVFHESAYVLDVIPPEELCICVSETLSIRTHISQYVISRAWWALAACLRHGCVAYIISGSISSTQWPSERLFTLSVIRKVRSLRHGCHWTFCGWTGKPQETARLQSCFTILSRGIYLRDDVLLLVLTQNTADVLYLNEHLPLFLQGVKKLVESLSFVKHANKIS